MPDATPPRKAMSEYEFSAALELYKEHCTHGRHIESQRSAVASMFLTATGILLSVIGALKFSLESFPLAVCVIGLAAFAKSFVRTYALKWEKPSKRRNHYREQMRQISGVEDAGSQSSGRHLRWQWSRTFDVVLAIGVVVAVAIVVKALWTYELCGSAGRFTDEELVRMVDCRVPSRD